VLVTFAIIAHPEAIADRMNQIGSRARFTPWPLDPIEGSSLPSSISNSSVSQGPSSIARSSDIGVAGIEKGDQLFDFSRRLLPELEPPDSFVPFPLLVGRARGSSASPRAALPILTGCLQTCLWVACYARCQPGSLELELLVARVRAEVEGSQFPSACISVIRYLWSQ
jgi:hypothetical protein